MLIDFIPAALPKKLKKGRIVIKYLQASLLTILATKVEQKNTTLSTIPFNIPALYPMYSPNSATNINIISTKFI